MEENNDHRKILLILEFSGGKPKDKYDLCEIVRRTQEIKKFGIDFRYLQRFDYFIEGKRGNDEFSLDFRYLVMKDLINEDNNSISLTKNGKKRVEVLLEQNPQYKQIENNLKEFIQQII